MSLTEIIKIVQSIVSGVSAINEATKGLGGNIKELKSACNISWMQRTGPKIQELKTKIADSEAEVNSLKLKVEALQDEIFALKHKISTHLPTLKRLITDYSGIKKDVAIAAATANKVNEILKLTQGIAEIYLVPLISTARTDHTRIASTMRNLPEIDAQVVGVIREKLDNVETCIRDLERRSIATITSTEAADLFQRISENYAGIEQELSVLLNTKILSEFNVEI